MAEPKNIKQAKVLHVTKTTAQWATETTVISKGLLCIEFAKDSDNNDIVKAKVGDGTHTYSDLPYLSDGSFTISDYYNKTETDAAITTAIANLGNVVTAKGIVATKDDLPKTGNKTGDLYFVGSVDDTEDSFAEYIWTSENKWEYFGNIPKSVDLSNYATITYVDGKIDTLTTRVSTLESTVDGKVDKETGKGLSTNDFTDAYKQKLDGIDEQANKITVDSTLSSTSENPVQNKVINTALADKVDKVEGKGLSTNDLTDELLTKLNGIDTGANKTIVDSTLSSSSTNPVENKAVQSALDTKVDKVDGKGLSTNDYTTAEKTKLASLENYDDTSVTDRLTAIEDDYLKESDYLIINCIL